MPAGFQDAVVFSGLTNPTAVRFAADGRVFVAEKSGIIKVYDNLNDATPTTFANLNVTTHNFWDRGLLGMALAPNFPADPWVYVLYTHDASIGGVAPRWGVPGVLSDGCPTPPGPTTDGCVVSGRLSRLQALGNQMTGTEQVLIEDWCQQYPSHSVGSLEFGSDGALYVSGGDGASFNFMDYGQAGIPKNPCGDPPGAPGSTLTPPTAEGGALRSQDVRTMSDPLSLDGAIARVDPATGAGRPDNPLFLSSDPNARRIIAHGFRNPFRITVRPGTSEVWAGDVGWNTWEEVDRLGSPIDSVVDNFGWPCYEGPEREASYDAANLSICENLYGAGSSAVVAPILTYDHGAKVVPGESCPVGSSSVSGLAFYTGGNYPDHNGALFFADYSRSCIWVMKTGTNGLPDPSRVSTFDAGAAGPVDLEIGPGGDLFYTGFDEGTVRRIRYFAGNQAPTAIALANPQSGPIPLTVNFDGRTSSDPEGGALTYSWDLNGDGTFGDSTAAQPSFTYTQTKTVTVRLRVTDGPGATSVGAVVVNAGNNAPPVPVINSPSASLTWRVGDLVSFSGSATDPQDGALPASSLSWELVMNHCPSNCHAHPLQSFANVASGSFNTPDHEYPSHLELRLTATDADGASTTTSVRLNPQTVDLSFLSNPSGLEIAVNGTSAVAPFTRTVIVGSSNTVSAVSPQSHGGNGYTFLNWSDGGAATHGLTAGVNPASFTANFDVSVPGPVAAYGFEEPSGSAITDSSGTGNNGTLTNATRTASGRFGSALTFNGSNAWVTIPDAPSLDLTSSMTLEAWVRPATLAGAWRTVLMKEQAGNLVYDLYASRTGSPAAPLSEVFAAGSPTSAQATTGLALNTWSHLASTYDGEVVRLYVNGIQVATQAAVGDMPNSTGALRIGGNNIWSEWFDGLIDEVRVYGRVLTGAEIQADMNKAVVNPDTGPPTQPSNLAAIGSVSSVALAWSNSSDDVGVVRYNVHRSTTQGFTPSAANRVGQPTSAAFTDSPLSAGTYYYRVTAEDGAGNISIASSEASAVVTGDTSPPTAPSGLTANGSLSSVALAWTGSTDNVGVVRYNVHRSTTNGFTPSAANRIAQPAGTSLTDTGLAAGTYYYRVTAEDAAGNLSAASSQATATVTGRHDRSDDPCQSDRDPGLGHRHARLDGLHGQRRRCPLQRPSLDRERLRANCGEPDRAADRRLVRRLGPRAGHLLLPRHRGGRRGERERRLGAGDRGRERAARGPRRRVRLRRRERNRGRGRVRIGQQRNARQRHVVGRGPLRRSDLVQRDEHVGDRPQRDQPEPDRGRDDGGLGQSDGGERLADGHVQGADRQPDLRDLLEHERQPAERAGVRRRHRPQRERHRAGRREHVDAPRGHVRRREHPDLRERHPGRDRGPDRGDHDRDGRPPHRRQRGLARVVPGPHRRGADLQPGAQRGRDPGRHGDEHRQPGHEPAHDTFRRHADHRPELRRARVDALDRQRGRRPLQRAPLDHGRLHAERGEPDRAAVGALLLGQPALARDVLLPRHRRGRRWESERSFRGDDRGRDRRRLAAHAAREPRRERLAELGRAHVDGFHRQRGRRPLQRPSLDGARVHARRRKPDRAARRRVLHGHGSRGRDLLLPSDCRRRGREPEPGVRGAGCGRDRGCHAADRALESLGDRIDQLDRPGLVGLDRQRGRAPLQRAPLDDAGLHPERRQPDRTTFRNGADGQPAHGRHLLLPRHRRGRRGEHQRRLRRGERGRDRRRLAADAAGQPGRDGLPELRLGLVDGLDRQRGRRSLQPPSLDHERLHAERGEPDRPADRDVLLGQPARPGDVLLPRHRRGRRGEHQRRVRAGDGRRHRRHHRAFRPRLAGRSRRHELGLAHVDGVDRQRGRPALQRPPLDHERLHAERGQPRRPADRDVPSRTARSRRRPTTTASPPRTPRGTSAPRRPR